MENAVARLTTINWPNDKKTTIVERSYSWDFAQLVWASCDLGDTDEVIFVWEKRSGV